MSSPRPQSRAVVDHNLFVSGLISKLGQPHQLIDQFRNGSFTLVISDQLRAELEEVLGRGKFATKYGLTEEERAGFLLLVDTTALFVTPRDRLPVHVRDPKDDIVLATALGGSAEYVVTGDRDIRELSGDPRLGNLKIVTVREFLEVLAQ